MLTKFVSIGSYSPEVRTFGTLITSTKVFSLIIDRRGRGIGNGNNSRVPGALRGAGQRRGVKPGEIIAPARCA